MSAINKMIEDWKKNKPTPAPTPPAPVPPKPEPPAPEPAPTPVTGQIKAAMFVDAAGSPYSEVINLGVTSLQGWAMAHGKSWENPYRVDGLARQRAAGSDTLIYIVDKSYNPVTSSVLAMCLADMGHPENGRHADPSEGWYDRCVAQGIVRHVAILRDSPDTGVAINEKAVTDLIYAYHGSRWKEVIYSTGLETDRNTTADQTVQLIKWFHVHAPNNRIVVGSAKVDFLLAVAGKVSDVELWLEQQSHPTQQPLTLATAPGYISLLDKLAAKVGAGKVWAGEWWAKSVADRRTITRQILAKGYNCGCGDFK